MRKKLILKRRLCACKRLLQTVQVIGSEANSIRPGCNNVWWKKAQPVDNFIQRTQHSCQPSRNGRDSPGILGLVPVVSRLSRNLRAPCASAFTRLDGRRSLNRV